MALCSRAAHERLQQRRFELPVEIHVQTLRAGQFDEAADAKRGIRLSQGQLEIVEDNSAVSEGEMQGTLRRELVLRNLHIELGESRVDAQRFERAQFAAQLQIRGELARGGQRGEVG